MRGAGRRGARGPWSALVVVWVTWGTTFMAVGVMVRWLPPLLASGVRYAAAGAVLLAWIIARRGWRSLNIGLRALGSSAVIAAALIPAANGLVVLGQTSVSSGLAALIGSSAPLWIVALRTAHREPPGWGTLLGVIGGLVGLIVLTVSRGPDNRVSTVGVFCILAGAGAGACGSFYSKRIPVPADAFVGAGIQMLIGGVLTGAVGLGAGEARSIRLSAVPLAGWGALAWLTVIGSLVGFSAYVHLLKTAPISMVSTTAYVVPLIAVVLGVAVLGEHVGPRILFGGIMILTASVIILRAESRGRDPLARIVEADIYTAVRAGKPRDATSTDGTPDRAGWVPQGQHHAPAPARCDPPPSR